MSCTYPMCDLGMKFSLQSSLSGKSKLFEGHVKPCVWLPTAKRLMILCSTLTVLLTLSHGGRPCITDDNFMNLNGVLGAGWMQWWCASRVCTASGRVQGLSAMTLTADPPTASFSPRTTWPPSSWSVPTHAFAPLSPHVIPVQLPAEPRASEMCLQTHKRAAGACGFWDMLLFVSEVAWHLIHFPDALAQCLASCTPCSQAGNSAF